MWLLRIGAIGLALVALLFLVYRQRQLSAKALYETRIHQSESLLQEVGRLALISGWKITPERQVLHWSEQAARIVGIPFVAKALPLEGILNYFPEDQAEILRQAVDKALAEGDSFDTELYRKTDGEGKCWIRVIGSAVRQHNGAYEVTGAVQNITERKVFTEVIQRQATYDILTELPNRFLFNDRLNNAVTKALRDGHQLAVLFIDLDNFKPVNDNLGHKAGDVLLQSVAARIKACVRDSDTVARYSGDEFTVILYDIDDQTVPLAITEKILTSVNQPYSLDGRQVFCSASIGISIYPNDGDSAEDLVSNADHAMYEVKKSGRNGWHYFTAEMQAQSEWRHQLHSKLQQAITDRKLEVFYQPIVNIADEKIAKCEALVRWFDDGQLVPTEDFIRLAEETGLINEIDRFVLREASCFLIALSREHDCRIGLSVNVSPRIFSVKGASLNLWLDLVMDIAKVVDLTVEITERLLTEDSERALHVLHKLKACGATVAIDDFGTGYSSLSYLTKFPIDFIKIDRSFVQNIGNDTSAETLTDTIISLASKLRLKVIAEGVEQHSQLMYLKERGCDFAQGYYLGKPQNQAAFTEQAINAEKV